MYFTAGGSAHAGPEARRRQQANLRQREDLAILRKHDARGSLPDGIALANEKVRTFRRGVSFAMGGCFVRFELKADYSFAVDVAGRVFVTADALAEPSHKSSSATSSQVAPTQPRSANDA